MAVAALNPHAGEGGLFGDEEIQIIAPAIARARDAGIDATGPISCDTLFVRALAGEFDAVVAMYHDQGHIALKTLGFDRAVNVTLGLPIIRTSVAHGTAFDIAWSGRAETSSLIEAVRVAAHRRRPAVPRPRGESPMTEVYLLRHGATALNRLVPYRLQGRSANPDLDDLGREQARSVSDALGGLTFHAAYSSPMLRALETARFVAEPHDLEPIAVPDLIEASLGRWEGLTWDEVQAREPEAFRQFHAEPGTVPYPDGESFLDVQRRATPALAALAAAHDGQCIFVVAHNVVNRAVLAGLLGLPIDRARALRQSNGGYNVIRYQGGKTEVVTMNACLHLHSLGEA